MAGQAPSVFQTVRAVAAVPRYTRAGTTCTNPAVTCILCSSSFAFRSDRTLRMNSSYCTCACEGGSVQGSGTYLSSRGHGRHRQLMSDAKHSAKPKLGSPRQVEEALTAFERAMKAPSFGSAISSAFPAVDMDSLLTGRGKVSALFLLGSLCQCSASHFSCRRNWDRILSSFSFLLLLWLHS